jgi:hypothetical protein
VGGKREVSTGSNHPGFRCGSPPRNERKPARTKPKTKHENMKTLKTTRRWTRRVGIAALVLLVIALAVPVAQAANNKPNVVIITGDDIGRANI